MDPRSLPASSNPFAKIQRHPRSQREFRPSQGRIEGRWRVRRHRSGCAPRQATKSARRISQSDIANLEAFLAEHPKSARFGVILHGGDTVETPAPNVVAVPFARLSLEPRKEHDTCPSRVALARDRCSQLSSGHADPPLATEEHVRALRIRLLHRHVRDRGLLRFGRGWITSRDWYRGHHEAHRRSTPRRRQRPRSRAGSSARLRICALRRSAWRPAT